MNNDVARFSKVTEVKYPVTYDDLLKHARAYGLDNEHTGYRNSKQEYRGYRSLRSDTLLQVARVYLSQEEYVQLVRSLGFGRWAEDARQDYIDLENFSATPLRQEAIK